MGYQALYRVWRSQTFDEVIGQKHVTTTLQNALEQQKISHAYLFSGPRGTGKTSVAKILAKAVNCEQGPAKEPCNTCTTCLGITDGSIQDVLEIDAASNNGVEEIRDIRDKVKYAPTIAKYKVYIIDEVHMLSTGAFNALLKTLEEPPAHVIFILATTEPHKIPLTIHSRCQRFDFKQITTKDIVERLVVVLTETGIQYEDEALEVIARAAQGAMRDALSLLDQAISFSTDKVTVADALTVTGSVSKQDLANLTKAILEKDIAKALLLLEKILEAGKEPSRLVDEIIFFYRDLLLLQVSKSDSSEWKTLADEIPAENLYAYISEWNKAQQEMKWSTRPRIFLEVVLVKLCQTIPGGSGESNQAIQQLVSRIEKLEAELTELKQNPVPVAEKSQQDIKPVKKNGKSEVHVRTPIARINEVLARATKEDKENILKYWVELREALSTQKKTFSVLLEEAEPIAVSSDAFVLKFKHDIHFKMAMNGSEFAEAVTKSLFALSGKQYAVVGVPETEWPKIREDFVSVQSGSKPVQKPTKTENPAISKALDLFGEELIEFED